MQQGSYKKERLTGMAGLWGTEDFLQGRHKQKAQIKRRWQREVQRELALREKEEPQIAHEG